MFSWYRSWYLDLLGSIYLYNEHRGYTAIDRVLHAVRARWPDDQTLIGRIQKHRADERKHYLMFRRWFEHRGTMPIAVDRTCGHIDRFVGIMFRLGNRRPRSASNRRSRRPVRAHVPGDLAHRETRATGRSRFCCATRSWLTTAALMKIFRIIERDEPSHWAPYDDWLRAHGRRRPSCWERAIDAFIHGELLLLKLPILFMTPQLNRRDKWPDELDEVARASNGTSQLASG